MTPDIVNKYEAMLKAGESVYLDPIEIDQIFRYYADNNQVSKLEDILRLGLNLHPDDPTIMQLDAEYTLMTNDAESALKKIDAIFQEDNTFLCILRSAALAMLGRKSEAMEMADLALTDENPNEYVAYDIALGFMNASDFTTAMHFYERSLRNHPDDIRTLSGMLYCHEQMGHLEETMPIAEKILASDPFHYDAWMAKGNYLSAHDQFTEALDAYDYAAAIAPDEPDYLVMKARCYEETNQHDLAVQSLREAADKAEGKQRSSIAQILANIHIDHKETDAAVEALWLSVQAQPRDNAVLNNAGITFMQLGHNVEAITMLEAANEVQPNDTETLIPLADAYSNCQLFEKAAATYEKLSILAPSAAVYSLWGGTMMSLGKVQKAYNLFKKANECEELWQTYVLMAVCDAELKHFKKMEEDFRYAYALCPDEAPTLMKSIHPDMYNQMSEQGFFDQLERERQAYILLQENICRKKGNK